MNTDTEKKYKISRKFKNNVEMIEGIEYENIEHFIITLKNVADIMIGKNKNQFESEE